EAGETVAGCGRRLGVGTERVKELRRLGREAAAEVGSGEVAQKVPGKVKGPGRARQAGRARSGGRARA
ncbi:hypothetical protein ABZ623_41005, partial [Streptomyces sp. NPDC007206]